MNKNSSATSFLLGMLIVVAALFLIMFLITDTSHACEDSPPYGVWCDELQGPPGPPGPPGRPGHDGQDGVDGAPGKDGVDGQDGDRGPQGIAGQDGEDGADGKDAYFNTDIMNSIGAIANLNPVFNPTSDKYQLAIDVSQFVDMTAVGLSFGKNVPDKNVFFHGGISAVPETDVIGANVGMTVQF